MALKLLLCTVFVFAFKLIEAAEGQGGMPQLNPASFSSQLFWLFIFFVILFLCLHFIFLPKVEKIKSARDKTIEDFVKETKSINESIEKIMNKIDEDLNHARSNYDKLIKETTEKNKMKLEEKMSNLDQEYEKKKLELDKELVLSKNKVLNDISNISIPLSDKLFEKLIGEKIKGNKKEFEKILGEDNV